MCSYKTTRTVQADLRDPRFQYFFSSAEYYSALGHLNRNKRGGGTGKDHQDDNA